MVKECKVILNNDAVTVVKYDETNVQFPAIGKSAKTVFVKYENNKYTIVENSEVSVEKKKRKKKVTATEKSVEIEETKNVDSTVAEELVNTESVTE